MHGPAKLNLAGETAARVRGCSSADQQLGPFTSKLRTEMESMNPAADTTLDNRSRVVNHLNGTQG